MKRLLLLLIICLSVHVSALAQKEELWDIYAGGKVGATCSTLTGVGGDYSFAPTLAGFVEVRIYQNMALAVELAGVRSGTRNVWHRLQPSLLEEGDTPAGEVSEGPYEYRLDYIKTNYLFKYFLKPQLNVYAGVTLSRLINARAEAENQSRRIVKHLYSGEMNIPVGVEYEYRNFTLDARYDWSFRRVGSSERARALLGNARNNSFMLTVGYKVQIF